MPYVSSNGRRCVVNGCSNTEKARYFLLNSKCNLHRQLRKNCRCEYIFKFHKFPSDALKRKVWVKNVNRKDLNFVNSRRSSFVVCSRHFPDGQPTKEHPYPILHMEGSPNDQKAMPGEITFQNQEDVEEEVLYMVTSLCDIICENDTLEESLNPDGAVQKSVETSPVASSSFSKDSISARRERRTIKKTFKARSFEAEKLFNRIRFGRPENRSLLLPLLRETIGLPDVKECFVKLHRIDVKSPVKLSELKDHPILSHEVNRNLAIKISSVSSLSEDLDEASSFRIKRRFSFEDEIEDGDSDFQEDVSFNEDSDRYESIETYEDMIENDENEGNEIEVDEENDGSGLKETADDEVDDDDELNEDDMLSGDEVNEENGNEDEFNEKACTPLQEEIDIQEDIVIDEDMHLGENIDLQDAELHELDFEVEEENDKPVVKSTPMSLKHNEDDHHERSVAKPSAFSVKHFSHNLEDEVLDPQRNELNTSVKVTFYKPFGNKTKKVVPVVTIPKRKTSIKINLTNPEQKMLPVTCLKGGAGKITTEYLVDSNVSAVSNTLSADIKSSFRRNTCVKIIQPYIKADRSFRSINKSVENYLLSSFPSPDDLPDSATKQTAEFDFKIQHPARTLETSDEKLKDAQLFSKIWMELHTYYDYTEEEEVTFYNQPIGVPDDDDASSCMMYEDDGPDRNELGPQSLENTLPEEKCLSRTGLSLLVFKGLLGILRECAPKYSTTVKIDIKDQVMIVLMKLKMGLINADLSKRFNTAPATCGKIFSQWLTVLHETLNHMVVWQSQEKNSQSMPEHFYDQLPLTTCLVDVGHLSVQSLNKESENMYVTSVKKFMYAVAPDGFVMFLSALFDGDISEDRMFLESGITGKLVSGDLVLANRTVVDSTELPTGVTFDVLPHLKPENEGQPLCEESRSAVERLKIFRILRGVITVPAPSACYVIDTCAALSNLGLIR